MKIGRENSLDKMLERYPWWSALRLYAIRNGIKNEDPASQLIAMLHPTARLCEKEINIEQLTHLSTDDLIDRFLKRNDYRIIAEEGAAEDLSKVEIEGDDDIVSEELAEIYENQGLYEDAIATYRKLSLLNSEKSIYFAGLISKIENKQKK